MGKISLKKLSENLEFSDISIELQSTEVYSITDDDNGVWAGRIFRLKDKPDRLWCTSLVGLPLKSVSAIGPFPEEEKVTE